MKDSFIKGDNENSLAPASLPKSEEYSFEYKTFIPQKAVGDPYSLGNYLIGDNRGYDPFSSKYRTSSVVNVGFWMPYMTHFKDVGLSKRCSNQNWSGSKDPLKTGTASDKNIKLTKDNVSTTKMQWRLNHDVGIPFHAMYPNITYYYEATLTKSSLTILGSHDKAPAHEFVMMAPVINNYIVIQRHTVNSSWDFGFLIPGAPQTVFNFSL